jgi:ABC-type amino acid transport system permease subunit
MRRWAYFRYIMLPQMWIESLPALVNEMSFLIKGSPAIAVIGVVDLTRVTNRISSVTYEPLSPILAAGLLYVVIIGLLLKLQGWPSVKRSVWRDKTGGAMNQWAVIWSVRDSFIAGLLATLELFITAIAGLIIGVVLCYLSEYQKKTLNRLIIAFVSLMRAIPF